MNIITHLIAAVIGGTVGVLAMALLVAGSDGEYGYVKVVRCRDCAKWHHIDTEDGIRYGECDEWKRADSYCVPATNEDGFCAWSVRGEVDNDN